MILIPKKTSLEQLNSFWTPLNYILRPFLPQAVKIEVLITNNVTIRLKQLSWIHEENLGQPP